MRKGWSSGKDTLRGAVECCVLASVIVVCGFASAADTTARIDRSFDSLSSLRLTQDVAAADEVLEAEFYSGYEREHVTISNRSDSSVRFSSYSEFVAVVRPGDVFAVPCSGSSIAGRLAVIDGPSEAAIDEQPLCGDLVLVHSQGESTQ